MFCLRQKTRAFLPAIGAALGTSGIAHAEPPPRPPAAAAAPAKAPGGDRVPVSVAFFHPLATTANRPNVISNADLSVLYGRVGKIEGLQLGGVVVHTESGVEGAQIGGVAAITGGALSGLEIGGVTNVARDGLSGAQIGGVFNWSGGRTTGLQLGGAANVATGKLAGVQLSAINVAGAVDGLQLGVVNVGKKVRGLQLGVVNIADEVDGGAIGLVSISRDSIHPIAWTSNLQYMNAGVKFTSKYFFTVLAVHYGTVDADFDGVGGTLAMGGKVPLPAKFDLELQGSLTQFVPQLSQIDEGNSWIAPQMVVGYSFASHLRAFAGGGARFPISVDVGREVIRPEVLAGVQF